jgi:hypothetical protein
LGTSNTEAELADVLGTKRIGTAISNVARLSHLGYAVRYGRLDLAQLQGQIDNGVPVIVRLWTGFLDYWTVQTSHVVVVVGLDETHVYLNDPAFADHETLSRPAGPALGDTGRCGIGRGVRQSD